MWESNEAETKIIDIINNIRIDQRKRPSFSEIFQGINKNIDEYNKCDLSVFKEIMMRLQSQKIIYDGGKGGKESFYVNEDQLKNINSDHNNSIIDDIETNINGVESNLYNYIDNKFHETLINMIKVEVKSELRAQLNNEPLINKIHSVNHIEKVDNDIIIMLKTEVAFLRNELLSKDKIMELLIKDKCSSDNVHCNNMPNDDTSFVYPKKSTKVTRTPSDNSFIKTHNRYQMLNTTPLTERNYNYNEDSNDFDVSTNSRNQAKVKQNRSTTIIGDSIVKDVKPYKMRKHIPKGDKLYAKSFSGATTEDMVDYIKPSLKYNPDLIILHTGVNNLRSNESPEIIADDIINLAWDIKTNFNEIVISGLVARNDDLNYKGEQVNEHLMSKCNERNLFFINNSNIDPRHHLNNTNHLNFKGTQLLMQNFLECINC